MLDLWDGFWFRAGQCAFEVGMTVAVLGVLVGVFYVSEWWKKPRRPS